MIFVPAWGWVGSRILIIKRLEQEIFVPAWGWVGSSVGISLLRTVKFSSPLGDGLVHNCIKCWNQPIEFSSPSGDGLVLLRIEKKSTVLLFFVPEWGWVGSADFNRNFKKSSNTI